MTPALGFELVPGVPQRLSEVVVHRACDGHRVGHGLCFFVVFPQAAAEVFLNHGVARRVRCGDKRWGEGRGKQTELLVNVRMKEGNEDGNWTTIGLLLVSGGAGGAAVHVTVRQVAVPVACGGTGDNRGTILMVKRQTRSQNLTFFFPSLQRAIGRTC